jgi:spoIIIJ-associated protein
MTEAVEASGPTVEAAIDLALERLGATEDEVEIQILSEGRSGGMLRRADEARVRVKFRDERTAEDLALEGELAGEAAAADLAEADEEAEAAKGFLSGLLDTMDLDGAVQSHRTRDGAGVEVTGPDLALLIGRRGLTLAAVQELTWAAVQRALGRRTFVQVDIEGYQARRRASLERGARDAASRVRKSGRPVTLEPMPARERRIVHEALKAVSGIETGSEGEEPDRRVVIRPV